MMGGRSEKNVCRVEGVRKGSVKGEVSEKEVWRKEDWEESMNGRENEKEEWREWEGSMKGVRKGEGSLEDSS